MSNTPLQHGTVTGLLYRATLVTILVGCGSSTEPEPAGVLMYAEVIDASGDVTQPPFGSPPPDLVRVEAEVARDSVTFRIRFAANTYDSLTTNTFIQIDTDQNSATGILTSPGLGMDYMVGAQRTQTLGTRAGVLRCPGPANVCPEQTGDVPVRYVANGFDLTIPLAFLGGDNGLLSFRVQASGLGGIPKDYAPDENQSPASTR